MTTLPEKAPTDQPHPDDLTSLLRRRDERGALLARAESLSSPFRGGRDDTWGKRASSLRKQVDDLDARIAKALSR